MKYFKNLILAFVIGFTPLASFAAFSPLAVSIVPPAQFPPADFSITGARLSLLWGHHRDVYGIDLGVLGNITDQDFVGIGVSGLFNINSGNNTILGLQAAGVVNYNTQKTRVYGLQLAAGSNYNTAESSLYGVQFSMLNISSHTKVFGAQLGLYNDAKEVYGLQIGVVNRTTSLHGVQIGLVNFNTTGLFYVAPILNVGF